MAKATERIEIHEDGGNRAREGRDSEILPSRSSGNGVQEITRRAGGSARLI